MTDQKTPPICDYEGSDYQTSFWDQGERAYEDQVEAIALKRLLPNSGKLLLELGAGAGRNTPRYDGFERVVLVDYSLTQLQRAYERLGRSNNYIYVAGNIYRLPFRSGMFDAATMIRTLHHMVDAPTALKQVRRVLQPGANFILEYANKKNLKSILRYLMRRQEWNPFSQEPIEFVELNFDFHPSAVRQWLHELDFVILRQLTVSHFRINLLKRYLPTELLVSMDSAAQLTGNWWQLTPSVFIGAQVKGTLPSGFEKLPELELLRCPNCQTDQLRKAADVLHCPVCERKWPVIDGIYDFRDV